MDVVRNILDWLSQNSRNLSEVQKREIHNVLESLRNQLETRTDMGSSSREHQAHQFSRTTSSTSTRDQNEKKFREMTKKVDTKSESLESKIHHVTNIINKETGYINGKIDTIHKEYNAQMKTLRNQIRDLKNEKKEKKLEKSDVGDRDINHLVESLKTLMNNTVPEPNPHLPNFNPPPPPPHYDCPPPYQPYPTTIPNQNIPYFPTQCLPQFFVAPRPPGPSMVQPSFSFPSSQHDPNLSKPPLYKKNENVYRFSGSSGCGPSGRVDYNAATGSGHQKSRFDRPPPSANDGKADDNSRKKYCDPYWKKSDIRHQQHGSKNDFPSGGNGKSHHTTPSHNEKFGVDSNKFCGTSQFKNYADRGKNKRHQQFGNNRPQNHDDGGDSDTSTTSHVSSKDTRKNSTVNKTGHSQDFKFAKKKNNRPKNSGDGGNRDTSTASHGFPKNFRKEPDVKTKIENPRTSTNTRNQNPQSVKKSDTSELEKLQYPSRAEALKRGIDIHKRIDPPSTCLGKVNGIPFSKPVHCLEDIYNFEEKFGPCQVIRY